MKLYGYNSPQFGLSFSELGEVITLPSSRVQVIKRRISGSLFDVFGVYPYTVTKDWQKLNDDLGYLHESGAVSIVLVSDPFAEKLFPVCLRDFSLCKPFKTHHVVDLRLDWRSTVTKNTRYYARRAMRVQRVEVVEASSAMASQFWSLYLNLIKKHRVIGIQRLSESIIARQLDSPGAMMATAHDKDGILGQIILFGDGKCAHAHLWGVTPRGYELKSSYAILWQILVELEKMAYVRVNFGGTIGNQATTDDGMSAFKRRWANEQRTTYLCGHILDISSYDQLARTKSSTRSSFFPAYRSPESGLSRSPCQKR